MTAFKNIKLMKENIIFQIFCLVKEPHHRVDQIADQIYKSIIFVDL